MGKLLALDYGKKRIGVAQTDDLKIIASPLITVSEKDIIKFLSNYLQKENVESIIIGDPKTLNNKPAEVSKNIKILSQKIHKIFKIPIILIDERFTSKIALKTMVMMNSSKKKRRNKSDIDKISAALILQTYLDRKIEI
ncbi:MAG: Holliday junction resolvase RuvX [Flavobacteriales bacterium]|nr:Holliday junction resolvase RuvX [Flavobacteriales bacterium]